MIKKTVSYENFDGETVSEDLYFHLNKAELLELEMGDPEKAFSKKLQEVSKAQNVTDVLAVFKKIIVAAYGVRSEDGKRFIKNERLREEFDGSEAYSEVLFELLSNPNDAAKFVGGLMPKNLLENAMKEAGVKELVENEPELKEFFESSTNELRVVKDEPKKDLDAMSREELMTMLAEKNSK